MFKKIFIQKRKVTAGVCSLISAILYAVLYSDVLESSFAYYVCVTGWAVAAFAVAICFFTYLAEEWS